MIETKSDVEVSQKIPVTITETSVQNFLKLSSSHQITLETVEALDRLLLATQKKAFNLREESDDSLRDATRALETCLGRECDLHPLSLADTFEAPSWMSSNALVQKQFEDLVNTSWLEKCLGTPFGQHLEHLFGFHASVGNPETWQPDTQASHFLKDSLGLVKHTIAHGAQDDARARLCAKTLETTVRLAINLGRSSNYGSLELLLPVLKLTASGIFPVGFRDDNTAIVFFK